ncbi:MAG: hypothetical protein H7239_03845 [Flavobacterium sp.]|nr:hypothetical protein [Flavobacterium sp.]
MDLINLKWISILGSRKLFLYLTVIALFPLVILSFFNNPASDDFDYSFDSQNEAFFPLQIRRYFEWSGRYFSNGLISLNPLTYSNLYFYKIIPIVLFLFFLFALFFFISNISITLSSVKKLSYTGVIFILYLVQLPDVCEGFYWMPASLTNQLPTSLTLLFFGFLLKYKNSKNPFHFIFALLILIATIGCNEITVVILGFILLSLAVYIYHFQKKINYVVLIILAIYLIFSFVEIFAPGNAVRASNIKVKHQLLWSIFKSVQLTISYIFNWFPIMLLSCLFFIKDIYANLKLKNSFAIHPFYSIIGVIAIVFLGFFPGVWSLNGQLPDRSINTIYFFFIFGFIYCFYTIVIFLRQKFNFEFQFSKEVKIFFGILILFHFLSNNPITVAYLDLFSGKAYAYNNEMKTRLNLIKNCKSKDCVVPALTHFPTTIYNKVDFGLTNDKNNWKNLEISRFYRKNSIIIEPVDSLLTE